MSQFLGYIEAGFGVKSHVFDAWECAALTKKHLICIKISYMVLLIKAVLSEEATSSLGKRSESLMICYSRINLNYINQSINQSILFLIKRYIINALSAVQWNTHISLNTYIYIYIEIQHTYKHSYTRQPFRRRYNVFISGTHTLTLVDVASGPHLLYSW